VRDFGKENYKTINNEVLINALTGIGVNAEASGRNDLEVNGSKISGSAYKLNLGKKDGSG
jgi:lipoate-protein ligase A